MSDDTTFADREYVIGYGQAGYGQGFYGGSRAVNNITDVRDNWPLPTVEIADEPHDTFLRALTSLLYRIDVQIDELYDQRFVDTATGRELEKLLDPIGTARKAGESDTKLRYRGRILRSARASTGTINDLAGILEQSFGGDVDRVTVFSDSFVDRPRITLEVPSDLIEENPITRNELRTAVREGIPALDELLIVTDEQFRLAGPNYTPSNEETLNNGKLVG